MNDRHPIYPNAAARESDRLREEKLAADLRGRVKELEVLLKDVYAFWYKPRTDGKNIDGVELRKDIEAAILKGAK